MKKNIMHMLFLMLTIFFVYTPNVFAESKIKEREIITIDGKSVKKYYDNTETGTTNKVGGEAGIITLVIDGKEYPGYCIDFGMYIDFGNAETQKLHEYFEQALTESATKELIRKLTLYTKFGYGSEGRTTDKYYLATQQLIWEAISDTGFYASDFYVGQNGAPSQKLRIENLRWTNDGGTTTIDVSPEINAIKSSIDEYYTTPSFCSSQDKLEIEVGETAEYTDNNNVLSQFEVTCDSGLTCEKNGNKLKVTAINEAGSNKITFSKTPSTGTESYVYRLSGKQGVIAHSGTLEPVSCQFGIDSFKNEKTADMQIIYIVTIGLFCGVMAYITYYTKKSLDGLK